MNSAFRNEVMRRHERVLPAGQRGCDAFPAFPPKAMVAYCIGQVFWLGQLLTAFPNHCSVAWSVSNEVPSGKRRVALQLRG